MKEMEGFGGLKELSERVKKNSKSYAEEFAPDQVRAFGQDVKKKNW